MPRDIDQVITLVRERIQEVNIVQMHKTHPSDDDGLWWFRLPGVKKDIQLEPVSKPQVIAKPRRC